MLDKINYAMEYEELELLSLYELFNTNSNLESNGISTIVRAMTKACEMPTVANAECWTETVTERYRRRFQDPEGMVEFLTRTPSLSRNPFFAFKIFNYHLDEISFTPRSFVDLMHDVAGMKKPKFVVLWRRRSIERFVSREIAIASKKWGRASTWENNTIVLERDKLEWHIQTERRYYEAVCAALITSSADVVVLEYHQDLRDEPQQLETMRFLVRFLGLPEESIDIKKVHQRITFFKQAQVPVEEQVKNW